MFLSYTFPGLLVQGVCQSFACDLQESLREDAVPYRMNLPPQIPIQARRRIAS